MKNGTTQGKMKGESMINPNVIIGRNMVIMLMNVEVPLIIL